MTDRSDIALLQTATLEWIHSFAPYGVIATDRQLCVRTWNKWMERFSGLAGAEVLGRKLTEIYPDLTTRRFLGQFDRALLGEVSVVSTALHGWLIPLPSTVRDAPYPFMKQTARIAPLMSGSEIHGLLLVIEDVTQREWQAEVLRRQHAREGVLAWALAQLIGAEQPRRIIREVFMKVAAHLDFDSYLLYLFDPEARAFDLHAAGGIAPEKEAVVRHIAENELPWLAGAGEGLAIVRENVLCSTDPALAKARQLGFRAYVVLPLISGGMLLGLLTFATRIRDTIVSHEAELLTTIAQYLSVSLNREKTARELRAAQERLNEHAHELEKKIAERTVSLQQIIAELQTFSYTIAHDLRAPIRAVNGYCQVLLDDYAEVLPPDAALILQRLGGASTQMDALTRDLLEFSKVSRQDLTLGEVDLEAVVMETVLLTGLRISSATQIEHPLHTVYANRTLVGQCVSNLLQNAVKFCQPGIPPAVRIRSELVSGQGPARAARRVRLWIEDNGIGISPEAQRKVFGIFERGDRASEYEGTGIGLAIVARAMERMGGACGVESALNQGSRFWLEFPSAEHQ